MIGFAVLFLIHLSLLPAGFVAIWIAVWPPKGDQACKACGYDLRGAKHEVCPECGTTPNDPRIAGRRRVLNRPLFILGLVLLAIPFLCDVLIFVALAVELTS